MIVTEVKKFVFFGNFQKICENALEKILFKRFSMLKHPVDITEKKKSKQNMLDALG